MCTQMLPLKHVYPDVTFETSLVFVTVTDNWQQYLVLSAKIKIKDFLN